MRLSLKPSVRPHNTIILDKSAIYCEIRGRLDTYGTDSLQVKSDTYEADLSLSFIDFFRWQTTHQFFASSPA